MLTLNTPNLLMDVSNMNLKIVFTSQFFATVEALMHLSFSLALVQHAALSISHLVLIATVVSVFTALHALVVLPRLGYLVIFLWLGRGHELLHYRLGRLHCGGAADGGRGDRRSGFRQLLLDCHWGGEFLNIIILGLGERGHNAWFLGAGLRVGGLAGSRLWFLGVVGELSAARGTG